MKKGNKKEHKELEKIQEKPKFFTSLVEILKKKWLVNRTMTLILIAIVVAIYIGINILLDKVILPEVDCTENKMYSISQETKDKIGDIDKEINIQIINFSSYQSVIDFIEKYIEVNNNIKIEKIDNLSARTDLMQKYSLDETGNLIIIKSGDNETTLGEYDLYTYDYTTYEEIDITEEAITNAILDVTTENKPKVYFLNSHLAYNISYYSTIMSEIENEANEVDTLDILTTGKIPDDCDCLVITTLSEDLTELERDKILEYISNGGKILLLCGPNIQDIDLSNFQKILDEYGVTIENGVVFEGSNSNMLAGYPDCIVEDVSTSASFMEKLNMAMSLCLTDAGKIVLDEDKAEELDVEYETIATTTEDAFIRTDLTQQSVTRTSQDSETGEITVAAMATKTPPINAPITIPIGPVNPNSTAPMPAIVVPKIVHIAFAELTPSVNIFTKFFIAIIGPEIIAARPATVCNAGAKAVAIPFIVFHTASKIPKRPLPPPKPETISPIFLTIPIPLKASIILFVFSITPSILLIPNNNGPTMASKAAPSTRIACNQSGKPFIKFIITCNISTISFNIGTNTSARSTSKLFHDSLN